MKQILFAILVGFIFTMATASEAGAQDSGILASAQNSPNTFSLGGNANLSGKKSGLSAEAVNAKAIKNFKKYFKADDEKWELSKEGFIATYTSSDGVLNTVYFTRNGGYFGTLKKYDETKLNKDIRTMVRQKYFDYKITLVDEIKVANLSTNPTYIVTIQSDTDIKLIRINENYEMDVYKEFTKS